MFLPAGSQDEIGENLNDQAKVNQIFRKVANQRGYQAIETPVVEYAETYTNSYVGMSLNQLLKWFDNEGDIEVLRADWTTAIARALMKQSPQQQKWFYQGSVFKKSDRGIESLQAGIEIIRMDRLLGEMETLFTAVDLLNHLEISNYVIELAHSQIFDELIKPLNLNEEEEETLRLAMDDKKGDVVYQIAAEKGSVTLATELVELIEAYGGEEILVEYRQKWRDQPTLTAIIDRLEYLLQSLEALGVNEVLIDLGSVRKLRYYSGTMFSGYLIETGEVCFSGGRYDRLYDQFEQNISAVGLAFYVDVLTPMIKTEPKRRRVCLLASPETHVQAEKMRTEFSNTEVEIQYSIPDKNNYDEIINVQDEVKK